MKRGTDGGFCFKCGSVLEPRLVESKARLVCPHCAWVHYEQLKVGVGALIERDSSLLLLQRLHEPFKGQWNLPAGYVDSDECPADAVVREVEEETGLEVEVIQIVDVYFFEDDPRGNGILIVYRCRVTGGQLSESREANNARYFRRNELPLDVAGGGHNLALRAWQMT